MSIAPLVAVWLVASAAPTPAEVDEFLKVSGASQQYATTAESFRAGFEQQVKGVDPRYVASMNEAILEAYAAPRLLAALKDQLLVEIDADALKKTMAFYKTPVAKKATKLEVAASSKKGMAEKKKFTEALEKKPPVEARLQLVQRLMRASHSVDTSLDVVAGTVRGMISTSQALAPANRRMDMMEQERVIGDIRQRSTPAVEKEITGAFLYDYQSMTDAELTTYIAFYESEAGASMGNAMNKAINVAFAKLAVDIGEISAALAEKYKLRR